MSTDQFKIVQMTAGMAFGYNLAVAGTAIVDGGTVLPLERFKPAGECFVNGKRFITFHTIGLVPDVIRGAGANVTLLVPVDPPEPQKVEVKAKMSDFEILKAAKGVIYDLYIGADGGTWKRSFFDVLDDMLESAGDMLNGKGDDDE